MLFFLFVDARARRVPGASSREFAPVDAVHTLQIRTKNDGFSLVFKCLASDTDQSFGMLLRGKRTQAAARARFADPQSTKKYKNSSKSDPKSSKIDGFPLVLQSDTDLSFFMPLRDV